MSDKLRTALKGGGRIIISVDRWANGDFHLCVTEDWARLTSIERATVSAEAVNAAEDPDGMIGAEIARHAPPPLNVLAFPFAPHGSRIASASK